MDRLPAGLGIDGVRVQRGQRRSATRLAKVEQRGMGVFFFADRRVAQRRVRRGDAHRVAHGFCETVGREVRGG